VEAFFNQAPARIQALADSMKEVGEVADAAARQELLLDLYLRLHAVSLNAELAGLHPAFKLGTALERFLKKLCEKPGTFTTGAQQTLSRGLELLNGLCVRGLSTELASHPPFRMLVVDDDPIARRVIGGALQTLFEKPDEAESGEVALTLAAGQSYDVIFLDVFMPGMDGFAVCPKLRETAANSHTPVIFITRSSNPELPTQSTGCGGSDFITKPFLGTELTVKALTFALRHRLQNKVPA
jgi:CheY-like chemotaxis protein